MTNHTPRSTQLQLTFEEWRDIPGYEGLYQVSNHGQVKRIGQLITTKRGYTQTHHAKNKTLGLKNGYYYLWLFKNNQGRKFYVHELVALAFIGPRPSNFQVHHRNENRLDNHADNLEYMPFGQHAKHHHSGVKNGNATITEDDVRAIRRLYKTLPVYAIAKQLDISYHTVWFVARGRTWKHIT